MKSLPIRASQFKSPTRWQHVFRSDDDRRHSCQRQYTGHHQQRRGGATAAINVAENATAVTTITATDADLPAQTLTYSIVGGSDSSLFSISSTTGALTFITGRNFETPADAGANNVYDVIVRVDDGTNWDDQSIAVTITNVNEAPTDLYSVPNVTNANVLGYYSFSSANNLGRDDAGDNQAMTLFGSPTQTTRAGGSGAIDLSGGQYGNIAAMTTGGAMTIASWVRFDTTGTWERVIDFGKPTQAGSDLSLFREEQALTIFHLRLKRPDSTRIERPL